MAIGWFVYQKKIKKKTNKKQITLLIPLINFKKFFILLEMKTPYGQLLILFTKWSIKSGHT